MNVSADEPDLPVESQEEILRLLVVSSDTYPPSRVDVSVLFGEELAGRGHRIDWILQSQAPCETAYVAQWGGGRVWVGPTDNGRSLYDGVRKHVRGIFNDLRLFSRMRSGEYAAIEVKDKFVSGLLGSLAAWIYRKHFIYWLSYPFGEEYLLKARDGSARYRLLYAIRGYFFKFVLYRILLRVADHVFVQSEQMRRDVAAEGIPLDKMTAVPMGIKARNFATLDNRPRSRIPERERCFLYLGTLNRVRRLDFLVRVLARVRDSVADAKLYIIGRGDHPDDEKLLLDEAERMGVSAALIMVGQLPQADAFHYIREADVCVSPFYPTPVLNSASPTKLVEYMAMGKAVVANDHPEQRLVIEQSGGGYCVPWDEDAFAGAIVRLLESPEEAMRMGQAGRTYALEQRSYHRIADEVEDVLKRVVFGNRAQPFDTDDVVR
jgi:glycosyltransferase involved in cell wall biosynthesis